MDTITKFNFSEHDIHNIQDVHNYLETIYNAIDSNVSGIQVDDITYMNNQDFYRLYNLFESFCKMVCMSKGTLETYKWKAKTPFIFIYFWNYFYKSQLRKPPEKFYHNSQPMSRAKI